MGVTAPAGIAQCTEINAAGRFDLLCCECRCPINCSVTPEVRLRLCLFIVVLFLARATRSDAGETGWSIRTWKSDDGLPNNHVTGLAISPDGYLWTATFSRPARFDGMQFEDYFLRDFGLPANQKITAIATGRHGLWLGTSHGHIIFLDARSVQVFTNGLPDKVTQTLVEDGDGALWATYQSGLVCRMKDGQVTRYSPDDGLPVPDARDQNTCSLARDNQGRIWFAKNRQAGLVRNGRFETLLTLPPGAVRLAAARNGGVWICSGGILMRFDEGKPLEKLGTFSDGPVTPDVLFEDHAGGLWLGTGDNGLFHYDGAHFAPVPCSGSWITSITEDREGNVWVGTESGGLDRLRPRAVKLETAETGLLTG